MEVTAVVNRVSNGWLWLWLWLTLVADGRPQRFCPKSLVNREYWVLDISSLTSRTCRSPPRITRGVPSSISWSTLFPSTDSS